MNEHENDIEDGTTETMEKVCTQLLECLDCFVVVGFTPDGEAYRNVYYPNNMRMYAMQQLLEDTLDERLKLYQKVVIQEGR